MGYSSLRAASTTTQMARDAQKDSEIMKTITVVTMIYLPATFVAVTQILLTKHSSDFT
jgi:Mg2+ and Co2+ transporter CorA